MSIPPDFTRRVQENPQIAVELYEACQAMIEWDAREQDHAVDFYARMDLCRNAFDLARAAIAKVVLAQTDAHYRNELALDAAERTGETPLPEHVRCVPGMGE